MMFMMPIPPTTNETLAIAPNNKVITFEVAVAVSAISCWLRTVKSSSRPEPDVVPLAQQLGDLLLGRSEFIRRSHLDVDPAQSRPAEHAFHRARVRHDDNVVLVSALRTEPFRREHAGDQKGHTFDSQNLSDRIFGPENLARGRLPDDADLVRAPHILRRKAGAVTQRPLRECRNTRAIRRKCG